MTQQPEPLRYEFEGGKYIAFVDQGTCTVTRHGELWRDLTGDKFVGCLFSEIDRLHEVNTELLGLVKRYRTETPLGHQPHMIALAADEAIAKATGETE